MREQQSAIRPVIVGEILFDEFENGSRLLGGAPCNVAWNLQGFGLKPLLISAVGDDAMGKKALRQLEVWGMDTSGIQTSDRFPTGAVQVKVEDGNPTYDILNHQAYDDIRMIPADVAAGEGGLLYVGSLAYRNEQSRSTIDRLIQAWTIPRFVDINIRQPWFDLKWLDKLIGGAQWLKLNLDELEFIAGTKCPSMDDVPSTALRLAAKYQIASSLITCGERGAFAVDREGNSWFEKAPPPQPMVDTVGAGDAFSAAAIFCFLNNISLQQVLADALQFASRTCSFSGALTRDREHYQDFAKRAIQYTNSSEVKG